MEKFEAINSEDLDSAKESEFNQLHANMFQSFNMSVSPAYDGKHSIFQNAIDNRNIHPSKLIDISEQNEEESLLQEVNNHVAQGEMQNNEPIQFHPAMEQRVVQKEEQVVEQEVEKKMTPYQVLRQLQRANMQSNMGNAFTPTTMMEPQ